jgi:hypothetical protein
MTAFWGIVPCIHLEVDWSPSVRLHDSLSQKAVVLILAAMRIWNLTTYGLISLLTTDILWSVIQGHGIRFLFSKIVFHGVHYFVSLLKWGIKSFSSWNRANHNSFFHPKVLTLTGWATSLSILPAAKKFLQKKNFSQKTKSYP